MEYKVWKIHCPWCTDQREVKADEPPMVCVRCNRFVLVNPTPKIIGKSDEKIKNRLVKVS